MHSKGVAEPTVVKDHDVIPSHPILVKDCDVMHSDGIAEPRVVKDSDVIPSHASMKPPRLEDAIPSTVTGVESEIEVLSVKKGEGKCAPGRW